MSSSQSSKVEVLWSPNKEDDFATYSNELKLYTFKDRNGEHLSATDIKLSSGHIGQLLGSLSSDIQCMPIHQRVAWQPNQTRPYFFAVGQSSGKVILSNLGIDQPGTIAPMNQVLGPKYGRPCTCLAWHPTDSHLLAQGLEKWRAGSSIIVWDVTRASSDRPRPLHPSSSSSSSGGQDYSASSDDSAAKVFDVGSAEGTSSLAWLPGQPTCLVAGIGTRYLRIYDIRETSNPRDIPVANHKAIHGLCVDPTSPQRLATYTEGTVYMWDIRHFSKPSYSFSRSGSVVRLAWLPTRLGCLSVVLSEPPYLRLMDIPQLTQSTDVQGDLTEIYSDHFTQRISDRCPYYNKRGGYPKLMGVAWHNKWENFGLITSAEGLVRELVAYDKISMSWAASSEHVTYGSSQLCTATLTEDQEVDISTKMRKRVKQGYGFDPCENAKLLSNDSLLTQVWQWLKLHRELTGKGELPPTASPATASKTPKTLPGVYNVLRVNGHREGESVNISKRVSWHDREGSPSGEVRPPFAMFTGSERQLALKLCGWSFGNDGQSLEDYLKREELTGNYERAAAIAVFQGWIRRGIGSLKDGAGVAQQQGEATKGSVLNLIALALSGYSPQEKRLWHETCAGVKAQVANPYLRAAFNFLCSSGRDGFKEVLNEVEMSLQDRVAFACTYLEDAILFSYISRLTKEVIDSGQINGLFLTGLTDEGITLLTNYVNKTGDVQTACLVAGQVMPFAIKLKQVHAWFQGYRDLLDVWQLWHERALFDGQRKKLDAQFKPPRQAFIMCNYCSKSIASDSLRHDRRAAYHTAMGRKMTSCPSCRKPLPRCSICLMNMSAAGGKSPSQTRDAAASKSSCGVFSQWFTWCQTCRHGGHAKHIADWFSNHQECPVANCSCHCFALDASI